MTTQSDITDSAQDAVSRPDTEPAETQRNSTRKHAVLAGLGVVAGFAIGVGASLAVTHQEDADPLPAGVLADDVQDWSAVYIARNPAFTDAQWEQSVRECGAPNIGPDYEFDPSPAFFNRCMVNGGVAYVADTPEAHQHATDDGGGR